MYIYLPVALTSINILFPIGLGFVVGILSGLFGVGGGFLMTPMLIMLDIPPTVAAATSLNQIVGASTSGTYAHWKVGNVDFKMGFHLLIGGLIGGIFGVQIIKLLREIGNADFVIKITYVVMLGIVGTYMFIESIQSMKRKKKVEEVKLERKSGISKFLNSLPLQTHYEKSKVTYSAFVPIIWGGFVGILAAIMGIGGGFLMVPVMIYILRMPIHVMVGTSLFQILFTGIGVTFLQAYINHNVDFILSVLLLFGSTIGAQIGVMFNRKLKTDQLKILFACIVLAVTIKMILELTLTPSLLLSQEEE